MDRLGTSANTKTISINESLFTPGTSSKPKRNKTAKKSRPVLDATYIQTQLMKNIQKRNEIVTNRRSTQINNPTIIDKTTPITVEQPVTPPPIPPKPKHSTPISEYDESLQFMSLISAKPKKNTKIISSKDTPIDTVQNKDISINNTPISTGPLLYKVDNETPHGCLKNGIKNTLKNSSKYTGGKSRHVTFEGSTDTVPTQSKIDPGVSNNTHITIDYTTKPPSPSSINIDEPEKSTKVDAIDMNLLVVPSMDDDVPISYETPTQDIPSPENNTNIRIITDTSITDKSITDTPKVESIVSGEIYNPIPSPPTLSNMQYNVKKTYRLGKHPTKRIVSIFCKNAEMINGIKRVHNTLRNTKVNDMKRYLIRRSLLSVGSPAPTDVIKQMYMSAISSGDVTNHNDTVLLHNYIEPGNNAISI